MGQSLRRVERLAHPIDLGLTCGPLTRGSRDPSHRLAPDELWRAANTPCGPATLHARLDARAARVHLEAWGAGAAWAIEHGPGLVGLLDNEELSTDHPLVSRVALEQRGLRMARAGAVIDVALATVIDQRVTGMEARRSWFGLIRRLGTDAPGPIALRVPPVAGAIASLDDYDRRRFGLEARRGAAMVAVAREERRLQRAADRGSDVLQRMLLTLPGVGAWTAAMIAHLVCGDADAVPIGDWHLPRLVAYALAGEPRGDDTRMLELLAPFAPQRARVVRLLEAAGAGPPRISPRAEIPDLLRRELRGERDWRVRRTLRLDRG